MKNGKIYKYYKEEYSNYFSPAFFLKEGNGVKIAKQLSEESQGQSPIKSLYI